MNASTNGTATAEEEAPVAIPTNSRGDQEKPTHQEVIC
jgi:hypothetical protein